MSRRKPKPSFGSISTGTLRTEDLLDAFLSELRYLGQGKLARKLQRDREAIGIEETEGDEEMENMLVDDLLSEAQGALAELALPYQYFGTLAGDGADFGFWFDRDSFDQDVHDGNVWKLPAGEPWPKPLNGRPDYIAEVNDHGNITLYTRRHREVWSLV
jgi:hypothetical protein